MKIINAKQIIPQTIYAPNKFRWFENCYIKEVDAFILTSHGNPNTHDTTKLFYHKVGQGFVPILEKWCKDNKIGLEDPHVPEKIGEWWYLSAEGKPYNGTQENIYTFKSKHLDRDWIELPELTITPTTDKFQNKSMSSPTNLKRGTDIIQYFECRGDNWNVPQGTYNATISYCIINTLTDKITYRHNQPIAKDVPDDVCFKNGSYLHSVHALDKDGWYGYVYKSLEFDSGLQYAYTQTLDGKRIGEIYFTDSNKVIFWHSNEQGMWEGYLDNSQPPNGGSNMKQPIIQLVGNTLGVINPISGAQYSWQYSRTPSGYDGWLEPFGSTYTIPKGLQIKGYEFWCYQKDGNERSPDSLRIVYGGTAAIKGCTNPNATNYNPLATEDDGSCIFEPSGDNELHKNNIKGLLHQIEDELNKIV